MLIQIVHVLQLSFDKFQADEQGWVDTIKSVNSGGMVRISTMDWLGQSQYASQTVFWPSLSSAISEVFKLHLLCQLCRQHRASCSFSRIGILGYIPT